MAFRKVKKNSTRAFFSAAETVLVIFAAAIFVFTFLASITEVNGNSMYTTLRSGEMIAVSRIGAKYLPGDIIVISKPGEKTLIKRIVATAGQTVELKKHYYNDLDETYYYDVTVDGTVLDEPYIYQKIVKTGDMTGAVTVPEGCVFVMGDNRNYSLDSRYDEIGMIKLDWIVGKVYLRLFPISRAGTLK